MRREAQIAETVERDERLLSLPPPIGGASCCPRMFGFLV